MKTLALERIELRHLVDILEGVEELELLEAIDTGLTAEEKLDNVLHCRAR